MVVVVRIDLKMGASNIAVLVCHASLQAGREAETRTPRFLKAWERQGEPTLVLKTVNEESLVRLEQQAS